MDVNDSMKMEGAVMIVQTDTILCLMCGVLGNNQSCDGGCIASRKHCWI